MPNFPENSVCVVGLSKAPSQNPITYVHNSMIGSFVVDPESGEVYDVQFNTTCGITNAFLAELLIGLSLFHDYDTMCQNVTHRYFGDSRKAILAIIRDAANKLKERGEAAKAK